MLLLTEGFDFGLDRWSVSGEVIYLTGAGLRRKNGITIYSANQPLTNNLYRQIRPIDAIEDNRAIRFSFWMKVEGSVLKDSEFISFTSTKEECGAFIGIDKKGKLYATRMSSVDVVGERYTDESSMTSITDGKYHFVEIYARYDADWTGTVLIYVDNVLQVKKTGANVKNVCWSRPDRIKFGNLIGANLSLDDIVVWSDVGNEYVGYRGSAIITSSNLPIQQNVLRGVGDYSFDVENKENIGAMVTISVSGEEAAEAIVRPVVTYNKDVVYGAEKQLVTGSTVNIEVPIKPGVINTSVGIERVK